MSDASATAETVSLVKPAVAQGRIAWSDHRSAVWEGLSATHPMGMSVDAAPDSIMVQVSGFTEDVPGHLAMLGSLDGAHWNILKDVFGKKVEFKADGMAELGEHPPYIRPELFMSDAAGKVKYTVRMMSRMRR